MKATVTSFIDPVLREPVTGEDGRMSRAWVLWLLPFTKRTQFVAIDTSSGSGNYQLPLARKNQNVELILKKTTGDMNTSTPVPSTGDTLDSASPLTVLSPVARYISDGVSTWHLV